MPPTVHCPHCTRQISLDLYLLKAWHDDLQCQPGALEHLRALLPAPSGTPPQKIGPVRTILKGLGF